MSAVKILLEVTKNLHDHVTEGLPKEERESYIERLQELLDQRQSIMDQLPSRYTKEELQEGLLVLKLNETIDPLLAKQLDEIKHNISLLKKKKDKTVRYANPYQVTADGMYFDKKK